MFTPMLNNLKQYKQVNRGQFYGNISYCVHIFYVFKVYDYKIDYIESLFDILKT
jgi:hypothetical protein